MICVLCGCAELNDGGWSDPVIFYKCIFSVGMDFECLSLYSYFIGT